MKHFGLICDGCSRAGKHNGSLHVLCLSVLERIEVSLTLFVSVMQVEIEIRSSGCVIPNLDNDKSATNKRRKHNEGLASSEASESPRETCGLPNVGKLKNAEAAPIPPYSLLELNKEQSESISQDGFHPPEQENPLEVDETVRDEKINRLKEILKEKQAALERMRKKVSPSSSESCSILEPL